MNLNYKHSGVDIDKANFYIDNLVPSFIDTYDENVIDGVGGFCSLYQNPLLTNQLIAASTDGVGSKLVLATKLKDFGFLETIGQDLVAMIVNDLITCGALPLFFLDYYAVNKLDDDLIINKTIIKSISNACKLAKISLIGGETAEIRTIYDEGKFDLAGFGIGIVDKNNLKGKHLVCKNDVVIGLFSNGPHSNGFALIQDVFKYYNLNDSQHEFIRTNLMKPTILYNNLIKNLLTDYDSKIHAMAHITGGGLYHNTKRVIPNELDFNIQWNDWCFPLIFKYIMNIGKISIEEMRKVFNCGIGFTIIVDSKFSAEEIIERARYLGFGATIIGTIQ